MRRNTTPIELTTLGHLSLFTDILAYYNVRFDGIDTIVQHILVGEFGDTDRQYLLVYQTAISKIARSLKTGVLDLVDLAKWEFEQKCGNADWLNSLLGQLVQDKNDVAYTTIRSLIYRLRQARSAARVGNLPYVTPPTIVTDEILPVELGEPFEFLIIATGYNGISIRCLTDPLPLGILVAEQCSEDDTVLMLKVSGVAPREILTAPLVVEAEFENGVVTQTFTYICNLLFVIPTSFATVVGKGLSDTFIVNSTNPVTVESSDKWIRIHKKVKKGTYRFTTRPRANEIYGTIVITDGFYRRAILVEVIKLN